jgi:hypothetical protein
MASEIVLIDDLTGSRSNVSTVAFSLDGRDYEIDLTAQNAKKLRKTLDEFIAAGRKAGSTAKPTRGQSRSASPVSSYQQKQDRAELNAAVRAFARLHGHDISGRGRIAQKYIDAYRNNDASIFAQPTPAPEPEPESVEAVA